VSDYYEKAKKALSGHIVNSHHLQQATAYGVMALVEELREARKPIEISEVKIHIAEPVVDPRDVAFVPGDMVGMTIRGYGENAYNGRHGVITYGPDSGDGWIVTSAAGDLRCKADELTMITRREDRTGETDRVAYKWKENK
jgi:hypothetical protein